MESIELIKENIRQTTTGRKPEILGELAGRDHDKRQSDLVYAKLAFEQKIADPSQASQHLSAYYQHALWLLSHFPEGPDREKELLPVLEKATRTFFNVPLYVNDPNYLKIWLLYVMFSEEKDRNELYRHMHRNGIGAKSESFYAEWAKYLEHQCKNVIEAREVFLMGIAAEAQPLERLKMKFFDFMHRNKEQIETQLAKQSTARKVYKNETASASSKAFNVFIDENAENKFSASSSSTGPFSLEQKRHEENSIVPSADWKTEKIPTTCVAKVTQKIAVLQDFSSCNLSTSRTKPTYSADLFVKGCAFISFEQWRIHQLLLKMPLSNMSRPERILPVFRAQKDTTNRKRPLEATPIPKNRASFVVASSAKSFASSPTVNTKAAVNEISSMFCENLYVSTSEDSFSEMEDNFLLPLNDKKEKFQIFNDQLTSENLTAQLTDITEELTNTLSERTPKSSATVSIGVFSPSPITKLAENMDCAAIAFATPTIVRPVVDLSHFKLISVLSVPFFNDCLRRVHLPTAFIDCREQALPDFEALKSFNLPLSGHSYAITQKLDSYDESSLFAVVKLDANSYPLCESILKVHSEILDWEYYILSLIKNSDLVCKNFYCEFFDYFKFSSTNVISLEYFKYGTLLNCINLYLEKDESFDELVAMYIVLELMKAVKELHRIGIIHCEIRCETLFVNADCNKPPIKLGNFQNAIDVGLFDLRNQVRFKSQFDSDLQDEVCVAIRSKKPFTFEIDYFGIASVAYALLFMDFISIECTHKDGVASGMWTVGKSFNKFQYCDLWSRLFEFLINASCDNGEPFTAEMEYFISALDRTLQSASNRDLALNRHYWRLLNKP